MTNWTVLNNAIRQVIYSNGTRDITGQILQMALLNIVNSVGSLPTFGGTATPSTNPGVHDGPVFYIATAEGTYANFNNIAIAKSEVPSILICTDSTWTKQVIGTALAADIEALGSSLSSLASSLAAEASRAQAKEAELQEAVGELEQKTNIREIKEEGLYICNSEGEALIRLDVLDTKGEVGENLSRSIKNLIDKRNGAYYRNGNITNGQEWVLTSNSVKHNKRLSFSANIGTFSSIAIGHGREGQFLGSWVVIDDTSVKSYTRSSIKVDVNHGLNIMNNIQVEIWKDTANAKIRIVSMGNVFEQTLTEWAGDMGDIYIKSVGSVLNDCAFSWSSSALLRDTWLFGDSYFSVSATDRWTSYLIKQGAANIMLNGYSGATSSVAYQDFLNLLDVATPKRVVWCLGMNDTDNADSVNVAWNNTKSNVSDICKSKNIELILCTIPTAKGGYTEDSGITSFRRNKFKNEIVRSGENRYIDFDKAVGADENTGLWYGDGTADDMLEDLVNGTSHTRVHPTVKGAVTLFQRAISDCPELN